MEEALRVPAWRRLGLKLKYAKEVPELASQSTRGQERNRPHNKRGAQEHLEKAQKKVRTSTKQPNDSQPSSLQDVSPNTAPKHRKSVGFTSDTKIEDGDSLKDLHEAWMIEQKISDPDFTNPKTRQALHLTEQSKKNAQAENSSGKKRPKREKQKKSAETKSEAQKDENYIHPALEYLLEHHTSPNTWKFNKAKQNFIIKHIFDLQTIPARFNTALKGYIRGLQGTLVRTRIKEEIKKVREEDEKALNAMEATEETPVKGLDSQSQKSLFGNTVEIRLAREKDVDTSTVDVPAGTVLADLDPQLADRTVRRVRVEMINLAATDGELPQSDTNTGNQNVPQDGQKRTKLNDGTVQRLARRRKRRTADMESSSSSSSSGSDSASKPEDSSDESDDEESTSSSGSSGDGGEIEDLEDEETSSSSSSSSSSASRLDTGGRPSNIQM